MNTFLVFCAAIASASANLPCGRPETKEICAQGVYRVALDNQGPTRLNPLPEIKIPTVRTSPVVKPPVYLPAQNLGLQEGSSLQYNSPLQGVSNIQYESAPQYAQVPQYDNSYSVASSPVEVSSLGSSSNYANRQSTYKVAVDNCGPKSKRLRPFSAPTKVVKPIETAPVTLPFKVPRPKTVSNKCKCVKTVVKPQPIQQLVIVPVVRKYVQTLARPVYETINYKAEPVNCPKVECYC